MLPLLAVLLLSGVRAASAGSVTLEWEPNSEPDLKGFRLYYGLASGAYDTQIDVGASTNWPVERLDRAKRYYFAVTAYNASGYESGHSNEVSRRPSAPAREAISTSSAPSGPILVTAGTPQVFTAGTVISSRGHPVRYRFFWSDGTTSGWLPAGKAFAEKSWAKPGVYAVRVRARCADHPSVLSAVSAVLPVTVTADPAQLLFDDFSTRSLTSRWKRISGFWGIRLRAKSLISSSPAVVGRILSRPVQDLADGRIEARFKLSKDAADAPNAGVIFSYEDRSQFRYVSIRGGRVTIGQVGSAATRSHRVSRAIRRRLSIGKWHHVRLDLHPDGTVAVFLEGREEPALVHRFEDVMPGKVGLLTGKARAHFDDFTVWDGTVLPAAPPAAAVRQ